jgi:hypothetical protein
MKLLNFIPKMCTTTQKIPIQVHHRLSYSPPLSLLASCSLLVTKYSKAVSKLLLQDARTHAHILYSVGLEDNQGCYKPSNTDVTGIHDYVVFAVNQMINLSSSQLRILYRKEV